MNFHQGWLGTYGAIRFFRNVTNSSQTHDFRFPTSERNSGTFVKGNRLWKINKCCSAGHELLASRFLSRLVGYLWGCLYF